jgi:hypothetical protein
MRIGEIRVFGAGSYGNRDDNEDEHDDENESDGRVLVFGAERFVGIEAGNHASEHRHDPGEQFFARARAVRRDEALSTTIRRYGDVTVQDRGQTPAPAA